MFSKGRLYEGPCPRLRDKCTALEAKLFTTIDRRQEWVFVAFSGCKSVSTAEPSDRPGNLIEQIACPCGWKRVRDVAALRGRHHGLVALGAAMYQRETI